MPVTASFHLAYDKKSDRHQVNIIPEILLVALAYGFVGPATCTITIEGSLEQWPQPITGVYCRHEDMFMYLEFLLQ